MNDPLRAQQIVRRQVRRRRRWRRLRVAVLVVMASSAVVAAAYGIDRLAVVVHKFYTEHHHTRPPASGLHNGTTSTTTTTPGPPRCTSPQLSALVSDWRETGGTVEETVALTNISATPCSLTGYPDLGVVAQNGTPLPAPNDDLASLASPVALGSTTASAPVVLAHGARASFELDFANICDQVLEPGQPATGAPNECYAGVWLDVTPPGGTSPLLVTQPVHLTYTTAGFQVGPFEVGGGLPLAGQPPLTGPTTSPPTP
ncbi:MAG TPA: DUF4232 domain-containing protein [Acidimicrobiales bacterium]|nr:DUF4232 domain-containing protein [Acidimicrobiales bacterium]